MLVGVVNEIEWLRREVAGQLPRSVESTLAQPPQGVIVAFGSVLKINNKYSNTCNIP
jgi:hypothetical protein